MGSWLARVACCRSIAQASYQGDHDQRTDSETDSRPILRWHLTQDIISALEIRIHQPDERDRKMRERMLVPPTCQGKECGDEIIREQQDGISQNAGQRVLHVHSLVLNAQAGPVVNVMDVQERSRDK